MALLHLCFSTELTPTLCLDQICDQPLAWQLCPPFSLLQSTLCNGIIPQPSNLVNFLLKLPSGQSSNSLAVQNIIL